MIYWKAGNVGEEGIQKNEYGYSLLSEEEKAEYIPIFDEEWSSIIEELNKPCRSIVTGPDGHPAIHIDTDGVAKLDLEHEMMALKQYLADTDYRVIKCTELGLDYATTYPDDVVQRQQARNRINEIDTILDSD